MFRESNLDGSTRMVSGEGALRHRDGSIDFDAYRERARRARTEALAASIRGTLALMSGVFAGKAVAAARHHAS